MKKLNQDIEDFLNINNKSQVPSIETILKSVNKKGKKKSIFDNDPKQQQISKDEIIIPPSLETQYNQEVINKITNANQLIDIKKQQKVRAQQKNKIQEITPEKLQEQNLIIKQELEEIKGEKLPDEINYMEIEEQIDSAFEEIPGSSDLDIIDIDIQPIPKKDKTGYFKTKVTIKKDNIPQQINDISSLVKAKSKGLIFPRVCDLRVIGNTNKTQLKSSELKLSVATVVFKPDFTKLKVNKGTRIMISIPESYSTTGNLLVYIQESRAKKILEINATDFITIEEFNLFLSETINEFYQSGYEITLGKLELRGTNNPLMQIIDIIPKNEFKAKPYIIDSHIHSVDFTTKNSKNEWLVIQIIESDNKGYYDIFALNKIDQSWEFSLSKPVTFNQLKLNLYQILKNAFEKDWVDKLNINDESDRFLYIYGKLTHFKLKKAMISINELRESNPNLGIILKETLSKNDTAKSINKEYDAESLIGKTNFIDYFILTFLAYQVPTNRKGSDYITKPEYIEKYGIKNSDADYAERKRVKTIDETGNQRAYFGRIYLFQLEYSIAGKKTIYRNNNWDELVSETGFLTNEPKTPTTKF
jgi:hypothetical protein